MPAAFPAKDRKSCGPVPGAEAGQKDFHNLSFRRRGRHLLPNASLRTAKKYDMLLRDKSGTWDKIGPVSCMGYIGRRLGGMDTSILSTLSMIAPDLMEEMELRTLIL